MIDTIIIGGGPSGMTAALYLLRAGKSVLILEKENFGGQIANSPRLENYPSIKAISGSEFASNLFDQVMDLGAKFELEDAKKITKDGDKFIVETNYGTHESRSVILATGCEHRKIGVEREAELTGKGISYCATCDGAFFKNQDVVVIGDANTALQYAINLSNYCKTVTVCTLFGKWFGEQTLVNTLLSKPNVHVEHFLNLIKFEGDKEIEGLLFKNTQTNEEKEIKCQGVFIAIGQIPCNENFKNLVDLDKGFIVVDQNMQTKTPLLYAIGDCRKKDVRQVVTAINDGAIAAVNISKLLG